jgi:hypothetical protein
VILPTPPKIWPRERMNRQAAGRNIKECSPPAASSPALRPVKWSRRHAS